MSASLATKRWAVAALMSAGVVVNYVYRVNIAHALIAMSPELGLDRAREGLILSAFSWGYVALMPAAGFLVDRFGAVGVAAWAGIATSLATAWSGAAGGFETLFASRIALGIGSGPVFLANARLVREDFAVEERGRATAMFDAGSYAGIALAAPLVLPVMLGAGWRASFVVCAGFGLAWSAAWLVLVPRLKGAQSIPASTARRSSSKALFSTFLRDRNVLAGSAGFFCYNYVKSFFLTWFPVYLVQARGLAVERLAWVSLIPPSCAIAAELAAGALTDSRIARGHSVTIARKVPLCAGLFFSCSIVFAEQLSSIWAVIGVLSFGFASVIAATPAILAIPGDIAPQTNHVGTISAIQSTVANVAGIVAPIATGALVKMTGSFGPALWVSAAVAIGGAVAYGVGVGELRPIVTRGSG